MTAEQLQLVDVRRLPRHGCDRRVTDAVEPELRTLETELRPDVCEVVIEVGLLTEPAGEQVVGRSKLQLFHHRLKVSSEFIVDDGEALDMLSGLLVAILPFDCHEAIIPIDIADEDAPGLAPADTCLPQQAQIHRQLPLSMRPLRCAQRDPESLLLQSRHLFIGESAGAVVVLFPAQHVMAGVRGEPLVRCLGEVRHNRAQSSQLPILGRALVVLLIEQVVDLGASDLDQLHGPEHPLPLIQPIESLLLRVL